MDRFLVDEQIKAWLREDLNHGDITSETLIHPGDLCCGLFLAKAEGVIVGLAVMERVFSILDEEIVFNHFIADGDRVQEGDKITQIKGPTIPILKGERLALNLLQHMSGIATETARHLSRISDLPVRLVDTRKTLPGLRVLEKYAVRMGGAHNHRYNLSEGVLIKDNHIAACGSIQEAIQTARHRIPHTMKIEIEIESLAQLEEALEAGADVIMLDNMDTLTMREAVRRTNGRALLEASGNVTLERIREIAETGVDLVSVGALTHSVKALDISLRISKHQA